MLHTARPMVGYDRVIVSRSVAGDREANIVIRLYSSIIRPIAFPHP